MIIKITLIILGVSVLFQVYFWCDDPRINDSPIDFDEVKPPKPDHVELRQHTPPNLIVIENNKPFITHLLKVDNDLASTEWDVININ